MIKITYNLPLVDGVPDDSPAGHFAGILIELELCDEALIWAFKASCDYLELPYADGFGVALRTALRPLKEDLEQFEALVHGAIPVGRFRSTRPFSAEDLHQFARLVMDGWRTAKLWSVSETKSHRTIRAGVILTTARFFSGDDPREPW